LLRGFLQSAIWRKTLITNFDLYAANLTQSVAVASHMAQTFHAFGESKAKATAGMDTLSSHPSPFTRLQDGIYSIGSMPVYDGKEIVQAAVMFFVSALKDMKYSPIIQSPSSLFCTAQQSTF
jgi:hypothetical protein